MNWNRFFTVAVAAVAAMLSIAVFVLLNMGDSPRNLGGPVAIFKGKRPTHGFVGVEFTGTVAPLTVQRVIKGSDAEFAGVARGDIVLRVEDIDNPDFESFRAVVKGMKPGETLRLTIGRDEERLNVRVQLLTVEDSILLRERMDHPLPE